MTGFSWTFFCVCEYVPLKWSHDFWTLCSMMPAQERISCNENYEQSRYLRRTKCYVFACKSTITTEIGCMHTILPQNTPDCPLVYSFLALCVWVCVCSWFCDRLHSCMSLTEPGACCVCLLALCRGAPGPKRVIWFFSIAAPKTCNLALMLMVTTTMVGCSNSSRLLYST